MAVITYSQGVPTALVTSSSFVSHLLACAKDETYNKILYEHIMPHVKGFISKDSGYEGLFVVIKGAFKEARNANQVSQTVTKY